MRTAALALAAVMALAGCSSGSDPAPGRTDPAPPPSGTGYYVGAGPEGVGASLDLLGDDSVVRTLEAALRARDGRPGSVASVGVASVVNDGPAAIPVPRFAVELASGGAIGQRSPTGMLRPGDGPAARAALARLASLPTRVPAGSAATTYVVLEGAEPAQVEAVRMVVAGQSIRLAARRR